MPSIDARPPKFESDPVTARAILTGSYDFLVEHPTNIKLFGAYLRTLPNAKELRTTLSVSLLDGAVQKLFRTSRSVKRDIKRSRANPAAADARAAAEIAWLLPSAALVPRNQVFLVALSRFLESDAGWAMNTAVEGNRNVAAMKSQYQALIQQRANIARAKVGLAPETPPPEEPAQQPQPSTGGNVVSPARKPESETNSATVDISDHPEWQIPGSEVRPLFNGHK